MCYALSNQRKMCWFFLSNQEEIRAFRTKELAIYREPWAWRSETHILESSFSVKTKWYRLRLREGVTFKNVRNNENVKGK